MKRTRIEKIDENIPEKFKEFLEGAELYDSSSSPEARVYFIDKECGFYLKRAARGSLYNECVMTDYFHKKGLGAEVLGYCSESFDWLLTRRVMGEDATHIDFISHPKRLCDFLGKTLRELHESDFSACPVMNRNEGYISLVEENFKKGIFDLSLTEKLYHFKSSDEAFKIFSEGKSSLKGEVLLHGDYCLPNVMLNRDFTLSGFIDLGNGGVGDRHIDIFWGRWTLLFNLGTDKYADRFFDAYGRDKIDLDKLKIIAAAEVFG